MQSCSLEVLGTRQVDAKSRDPGNFDPSFSQSVVEHVAATLAIVRYVVHMEAGYVDSLDVLGTPNPMSVPGDSLKVKTG